jgi:peptidoglycan-associated lipoprotein
MTERKTRAVSHSVVLALTGGNVASAGLRNRRGYIVAGLFLLALGVGCSSRTYPKCDNDTDCNVEGHKGVCIDGTCQECGKDGDCQSGFRCERNRCVPKPECEADSQCTAPKVCRNARCVLECTQDTDCGGGQSCKSNRCVSKGPCTKDTECGPKGKCLEGQCAAAAGACTLESVRFAYNESSLDDTAKSVLQKNADCMKSNPPVGKVTVEANCDERGTEEYNLHLGQRRADTAVKYVVNLGVSKSQLKTLSYGKDKPICTESHEGCWSQNRRVDFTQPQ